MIEPIEDMPQGTIVLRASRKLSLEDYRDVLEPALSHAVQSGELRLVFVLTDFKGLEPGAWIEDGKDRTESLGARPLSLEAIRAGHRHRVGRQSDAHVHLAHPWRSDDLRPLPATRGQELGSRRLLTDSRYL